MIETLKKKIDIDKLRTITIATFVCGMLAHAYVYLNAMYVHDSANVYYESFSFIAGASRTTPFSGLWNSLLGETKIPWISGIIELIIYSFSTYLTCEILDIRSKQSRILVACILVANPACISANVYAVNVEYTIALLFAVLGTFFIIKTDIRNNILGILFVLLCLGTYGPYVSWSIALFILKEIKTIYSYDKMNKILREDIKAALCYFISLLSLIGFCGLLKSKNQERVDAAISTVTEGNSSLAFFEQLKNTVISFVPDSIVNKIGLTRSFNSEYSGFFIDNTMLVILFYITLVLTVFLLFYILRKAFIKALFLFIYLLMLVVVLDLYGIVTLSSTLMQFAYITPWILFIMSYDVVKNNCDGSFVKIHKIVVMLLSIITIISEVLLANTVYLKEENTYVAALMLTNRIADKMESVEGYIPGQTEVWFIGDIKKYYANEPNGYEIARDMMGVRSTFFDCGIHIPINMENYLVQHAKLNVKFALEPCFYNYDSPEVYYDIFRRNGHNAQVEEFVDAYYQAGTFPDNDCAFWSDGVLIFKLGSCDK